ncbi:Vegetative incompatibility protein [Paramyrothecium foliicola]|nr:Vegetative incompatibility protein [Paramyrothecium foliicola]
MRLEFFDNSEAPPYAILSHTWEYDEVTFEDFHEFEVSETRQGWQKITATCNLALAHGLSHAWVDCCCIDKSSSAELSEAINSMFTWYGNSAGCYAYLSDYEHPTEQGNAGNITSSRWFTRGWTLQELIAPNSITFYDKNWTPIGTRADLSNEIAAMTYINKEILQNKRFEYLRGLLDSESIAMRMSWAAPRTTRRPEDMAYCLLGIFGISTPMLYGEGGERAFMRLQEEIIKESNDMSIFAWKQVKRSIVFYHESTGSTSMQLRGILANSPAEFYNARYQKVAEGHDEVPEYTMTNKGLRIEMDLKQLPSGNFLMPLHCISRDEKGLARTLCILLRGQGNGIFTRVEPGRIEGHYENSLTHMSRWRHYSGVNYVIKRTPIALKWTTEMQYRVAFQFAYEDLSSLYECEVIDRGPQSHWDNVSGTFVMSSNNSQFACYERVAWRSKKKSSICGEFAIVCGMQPTIEPWLRIITAKGSPGAWMSVKAKDMVALETTAKVSFERSVVLKSKWPHSETVVLSMKKEERLQAEDVLISLIGKGFEVFQPESATAGADAGQIRGKTYRDDVSAIHKAIEPSLTAGKEIVLVCHSYGGIPASASAEGYQVHERKEKGLTGGIKHIVYMAAAALPTRGLSLFDTFGGSYPDWMKKQGDVISLTDFAADALFNDENPQEARCLLNGTVLQSAASFETPAEFVSADTQVPKTYIACECDNAMPFEAQLGDMDALEARDQNTEASSRSKVQGIQAFIAVCLVLCAVFTSLRFYVRLRIIRSFRKDDWAVVITLFLMVCSGVMALVATNFGLGSHTSILSVSEKTFCLVVRATYTGNRFA